MWGHAGGACRRLGSRTARLDDGACRLCGGAFFGGLSVWFDNDLFIKIKPTVLTCLLAAIIAGGRLIGRNPLGAIIGTQLRMSEAGWRAISWIWVVMFLTTALANEIAWRTLSTDDWVTFKVFRPDRDFACFHRDKRSGDDKAPDRGLTGLLVTFRLHCREKNRFGRACPTSGPSLAAIVKHQLVVLAAAITGE